MTMNESGLRPKGRAVLIRPYEPQAMSSIIEMPASHKDRMASLEQRAVMIEAGPSAWFDEPTPRAVPGEHIIVTKFAGYMALGKDGLQYRVINDRDVFCGVEAEEAPVVKEIGHG